MAPDRRSPLLALLLVVGLAACVALPPGASATATGSPSPTSILATATPDSVTFGESSTLTIHGAVSVPGALLTLSGRTDGTPVPIASTTAAADGGFSFAVVAAPAATTEYAIDYAGDDDHPPATATVTVTVRPLVTLTSPRTAWLDPGEGLLLSGAVEPEHPGGEVLIDRRLPDGTWTAIAAATLDAGSRFTVDLPSIEFGRMTLRARMGADAKHGEGESPPRELIINRRNIHRVPYEFAHYIVTVVHEYRLYYYEHGEMVRSFTVALGRPGYRTPIGTFAIYHKRRPGGGPLGSCAMFYRRAGGIAIHGTNQPGLLSRFPRPFSHGCARMHNAEALWLYYRCPVGTPVRNLR
jgi:hypothetical protein